MSEMRGIILRFSLLIFLMGCTVNSKDGLTLLPREYYRPIISVDEIGAAYSKSQDAREGIVPLLMEHEKISDAISITHDGETIVGLRLKPYYRHGSGEVIQEISSKTTIEVSNIIDDPRKYRILERLSKEKEQNGVSDLWLQEWTELRK